MWTRGAKAQFERFFFLLFFVLNLLQPLRITVRKSNLSQGHCYRFLCLACVVGYRFRGSILMFYDVMLDRKSDELRSFREFLPIKAHSNSSIRLHSFYQFTEIECAYNLKMKINKQDSQLNYVLRSHFFFLIVKSLGPIGSPVVLISYVFASSATSSNMALPAK